MNWFKRFKLRSLTRKARHFYLARQDTAVSDVAIKKEIALHYQLAAFYDKYRFDKKCPHAEILAIESYRMATNLDDIHAAYMVGKRLMEQGKYWQALRQDFYGCPAHDDYAKQAFAEAFAYLEKAENREHPLAKRIHGLAYIHGWGVDVDQDKGFAMIVDSIDQENAWDKATKIFEDLGLNKPEFFSTIMSLKGKKGSAS